MNIIQLKKVLYSNGIDTNDQENLINSTSRKQQINEQERSIYHYFLQED
jgi:hypothetical protein